MFTPTVSRGVTRQRLPKAFPIGLIRRVGGQAFRVFRVLDRLVVGVAADPFIIAGDKRREHSNKSDEVNDRVDNF